MMSLFNAVSMPKVKARGGCLLPSLKDALAAWVLGTTFPALSSGSYIFLLLLNSSQDEVELIWCRAVFLCIPFRNKIERVVKNPDFLPAFRRRILLWLCNTRHVAQTLRSVIPCHSLGSTNSPGNFTECPGGAGVGTDPPAVPRIPECCKVWSSP